MSVVVVVIVIGSTMTNSITVFATQAANRAEPSTVRRSRDPRSPVCASSVPGFPPQPRSHGAIGPEEGLLCPLIDPSADESNLLFGERISLTFWRHGGVFVQPGD